MHSSGWAPIAILVLGVIVGACTPPPAPRDQSGGVPSQPAAAPARTLVASVRVEPSSVSWRPFREAGVALFLTRKMFNAELGYRDAQALSQPYLAEGFPSLHSDGWRVFPDGRMETTYRLKAGLTWHDGTPLTAEDFAFSWRVYSTPVYGQSGSPPFNVMEEVVAADDRTVVVRWRAAYPDAGTLTARSREFPPLPRHLLQDAFQPDNPEALANHGYWTRDYLGAGAYRLDRWEPGAFLEGVAFPGHVLGRAKIERIKVLFMPDANAALASMLSGDTQLSADTSLRLEQATILDRDWKPRGLGTILEHPNQWRASNFQLRPDMATPRSLLDSRVRKALAHGVDKDAINDSVYKGRGIIADFIVSPISEWGPAVEGAVAKYPLDLRRSEQLMNEAGFTKAPDGFYASPTEGRFITDVRTDGAADNEAETTILAATWRTQGFDAREYILATALAQDPEHRATFPGIFTNNTTVGEATLVAFGLATIPRPENRWTGGNRGGWVNEEYDRLVRAFNTTLDQAERAQQVNQMARLFTEDLSSISLFFRTQPWAFVAALKGPVLVPPETHMSWNLYQWELQ